jgi:CubicO group peptidase (beta-lactamase class C family)
VPRRLVFVIPRLFVSLILAYSSLAGINTGQDDAQKRLDGLFSKYGPDGPGCVVAAKRDGEAAIVRAYGMASLEHSVPNTPATIFNAASIAKPFTAAAILRLAEAKKLSLDDPVHKYVPELPDYGAPISIRHLIHHTSGLRDEFELLWLAGGRDDDPMEDEDVVAVITRQAGLNFPPGTQHLYSNTNYTLLALTVRRVSGEPLASFASKELFAPAGMKNTFFRDSRYTIVKRGATGYRGLVGGRWGVSPYVNDVYGSGNLFSTAEDLVRWYETLFTDPGYASLAREALRRGQLSNGDSVPYGAGTEVGTSRGNRYAGHGGNAGGASAYAMRFLDRAFSVAVTCNGREIDAYALARETAALFVPAAPASSSATPISTAPVIKLAPAALERFAGIYVNPLNLQTRRVTVSDGRLVWARGPGTPLDAIAPNRFAFPGQPAELFFPAPAPGADQEMHLVSGGVTVYRRAAPFVMPSRGLADYAGDFTSHEVGVTLTIAASDSALVISTPGSWRFRAEPIFRDAFALPDVIVLRFTRDRRGRVDGMIADMSRSRGLRFERRRP